MLQPEFSVQDGVKAWFMKNDKQERESALIYFWLHAWPPNSPFFQTHKK